MPDLRAETDDPIFISYSRHNTAFARDLYTKLQALGFRLWRDRSEMEAGGDWWAQIKEAIEGAGTMVLVMSPKALASPVVAKEWRYARQVGTRVIPVIGEDVDFERVPRWMARLDWLDFREGAPEHDLIWPKFIRQLNLPYEPVRVPFMADALPPDFVLRSAELEGIVGKLLDKDGEPVGITAALRGAGGYGKTTLARAVCHDERIGQAFDDGILWVELGEQPGDAIGRILDLIVILSGERPPVTGLEAARTRLTELLADKDILMIIDDVWDSAHLKPFLVAAPRCARLITTRNSETLPTGTHKIKVDAMQPAEAVALLSNGVAEDMGNAVKALAARLGEWPLLLKLANGVIRNRVEKGQSLADALTYVNTALDKRGLTVFDQANSDERNKVVAATIGISINLLNDDERKRYGELAIFPEDVDVPLAALEKLWGLDAFDTEQICERLDNLSLVLRFDLAGRTIRLHDVIRTYLIREQGSTIPKHGILDDPRYKSRPALVMLSPSSDEEIVNSGFGLLPIIHRRFLQNYDIENWADLPENEPYLWDWLGYHLIEAIRGGKFVKTIQDLRFLAKKTHVRDAFAVESDLVAAEEIAQVMNLMNQPELALLNRQFANMTHILNRCETLPEVMATLHSRLQHLPELANACANLEHAIPCPFIIAWHPLPDLPHPALVRTLDGHTTSVNNCVFSQNGKVILSGSSDNTLKLWDGQSGAEIRSIIGHEHWLTACAISPDRKLIVSASLDNAFIIWDANSGVKIRTLVGHTDFVTDCIFSPDGTHILSASVDQTLKLWAVSSGEEIRTFSGHKDRVNACVLSPDGQLILSASSDHTLKIWDSKSGDEIRSLEGHSEDVWDCDFSPDGQFFLSASYDKTLKIWDTQTGEQVHTLIGHNDTVNACAFSPDGQLILSASGDMTLKLWNAKTGVDWPYPGLAESRNVR